MEVTTFSQENLIVYELPLTDAVRIALRLENLFSQFDKTVACTSILMTKNAMTALLKILEVTDRPDLKSRFSQTMTQFAHSFTQLGNSPKIDRVRLEKTLRKLESLNEYLYSQQTRIGDPLRQNDFLSQIRANLATPGGVCDYRLPAYLLWQNQAPALKTKDLKEWIEFLKPIRDIAETILLLTRDSGPFENVVAEKGFYSQQLNPVVLCHLVRVGVSASVNLYPEFSAGKHRLTIRFLSPSYFGHAKPSVISEDVSFQLACCRI